MLLACRLRHVTVMGCRLALITIRCYTIGKVDKIESVE